MFTGNLEYIMSSLPNLSFSDSEAIRHDVTSLFKRYASEAEASEDAVTILTTEAKKYLSTKSYKRFRQITLQTIHQDQFQNSALGVVSEFSKFMFQLKDELRRFRDIRTSEDTHSKPRYELITDLPKNPLEAELYLLKLQWQQLEALSLGHYSDESALIVYKLKLELLSRWWGFNTDIGFEIFQQTLKEA